MGSGPDLPPALSRPPWSGTLRRDLVVTAAALALLLAWDLAGLDLTVTRWFGRPQGFVWRDQWLTRNLLHDGGRMLAWGLMALLVVNIFRPLVDGPEKAERVRWVLVTLACLLAVPTIKRFSQTSCPWDLQEFGGVAAYVPHWAFGSSDGGPGHCFPSGHAFSAFAFFSGYFALRPHRRRAARWWLAGVLVLGALFGWAQLARGAHHLSHTLWSAWFSWLVCVLLGPALRLQLDRPAASASPG